MDKIQKLAHKQGERAGHEQQHHGLANSAAARKEKVGAVDASVPP